MDSSDAAESHDVRAPVAAPPVEVVVVAHEPGDWFDEALHSIVAQDYPRFETVILAAGQSEVIRERVEAIAPRATVREVDERAGYGRSANEMLAEGDRPAFYFFCHDDVALAPDTLRLLVEEALRSNASVVGPKLVDWDRPEEILDAGLDVDKLGHAAPRVELGELDQEQHDAVVDVFAISGAAQLIRADLFHALEGFDAEMSVTSEDIDFCWRSHVAGARVMMVPSAVARHRQGLAERRPSKTVERLRQRHRVRTILSVYGVGHSLRVLPQGIVYTILRAVGAVITGHFSTARAAVGAWFWNLRRPGSLYRRRASLRSVRKVPDREIRSLQVGGFAPVTHFLRGTFNEDGGGSIGARSRNLLQSLRSGPSRVSLGFWAATAVMLGFGSRHLLTRSVPVVGDMVPFDLGAGDMFARFFDSWWPTGTGHEGAAPTAYGLLGAGGVVFLGAMGLLRTVLTVGMLPLGAIGMWRFLRPFSSPWIRVVGTLMYLATPVPYNALSSGTWSALLLFGLLPWVLGGIGRAGRIAPFGRLGGAVGEGVLEASWTREVLALGLPIALLVAFVPVTVFVVVAMVVAVAAGSLLSGWPGGSPRMFAVVAGALGVALALNLPWFVDAMAGEASWDWFSGTRPTHPEAAGIGELLRFDTGHLGSAPLGWALPIAGLVPLLLARGPRWAWAVRGLCLYLAAVATVWASGEGWVPFPLPRPEVVLVAGALGLAVSTSMGVAAIERDLRTYRFGWRQLAPVTAVVAVVLGVVPVTGAVLDGDWNMPGVDFNRQFAQQPEPEAPQRVLWLGHDDVLTVGGRSFRDDLTVSVSPSLTSSITDRWASTPQPADPLIAEALELAIDGGTSRLGRLLAPFGVGEIIVLEQSAPAPATGLVEPVPREVLAALTEQLDLAELDVSPGVTRYRNTAVLPVASLVPSGTTSGTSLRDYAGGRDIAPDGWLEPTNAARTEFTGTVDTTQEVYAAVPNSSAWRLQVNEQVASKSPALEWALSFQPSRSGDAVLSHRTSTSHRLFMGAQMLLWGVAIVAVLRASSRAKDQV